MYATEDLRNELYSFHMFSRARIKKAVETSYAYAYKAVEIDIMPVTWCVFC